MQTIKIKSQCRAATQRWRSEGEIIAFVPTMGNLHEGHLKLMDVARQHASKVIVSIFVNPTQFGVGEDIDSYPRTFDRDCSLLAERDVDLLFAPATEEIYNNNDVLTQVEVPGLSSILCGEFRPAHFVGVTTIVAKLFNIVQPDIAVFGEKDFQQLFLIKKMVHDLDFPIKVLGVPTVRESDGLAMSSRNSYLDSRQRKQAAYLHQYLALIVDKITAGERDYKKIEENAAKILENKGLLPDYVSIRRVSDLQPAKPDDSELVILSAVKLGSTRLIDNMTVELSGTI